MTDAHTRPGGRPKNTGQPLFGSIARVRVDITDEVGLGLSERVLLGEGGAVAATGVEVER